jgi:pterin-4a-carbinolamine dehydratase
VRRKGGGGKPLRVTDPTLIDDLRRLVEPATLGSPVQPLRWVSKSREKLARALREMGHEISASTVGKLLTDVLGFSRQVNRKADEGSHHPDRNAQLEHINTKVVAAQAKGEPVISVDTKKKELVGNYRNAGSDYRPAGPRRREGRACRRYRRRCPS